MPTFQLDPECRLEQYTQSVENGFIGFYQARDVEIGCKLREFGDMGG